MKGNLKGICEPFLKQAGNFLTIRQGTEDGCRTEAAITGHGTHPHLYFILSGPTKVRQHNLVFVTLCVEALILATPLLRRKQKTELVGLEMRVSRERVRR